MLTVGERIEVVAHDLDYQGQGVARYEGYVLFIPGLLPGEEALVQVERIKKRFGIAQVVSLRKLSGLRSRHLLTLGSANLVHLDPQAQCEWQKETTVKTLQRIAGIRPRTREIICDERVFYYRNKVVFHALDKRFLTLGLFASTSHRLVPIRHFLLASKKANEILERVSTSRIEVPDLVHFVVRTNPKNEALVTLVTRKKDARGLGALVDRLRGIEGIVGITHNIKQETKRILGPKSSVLFGRNRIEMPLKDFSVEIDDRSFFQVNDSISEAVYREIAERIDDDSRVIDAYSGIGAIGFYLAANMKRVTMIETNERSLAMAKAIASDQGFRNVDIIDKDVGQAKLPEHDVMIVDPPRQGLSERVVERMLKEPSKRLFYLSCDPKTLARDLGKLVAVYRLEEVIPVRMFPQTSSIETLVVLTRKEVVV
ncbi:MAG: 23S rRNA (uracil(1939)-C(5))-methyltransferase RlmD [Acholeplasmataceae bacterium]